MFTWKWCQVCVWNHSLCVLLLIYRLFHCWTGCCHSWFSVSCIFHPGAAGVDSGVDAPSGMTELPWNLAKHDLGMMTCQNPWCCYFKTCSVKLSTPFSFSPSIYPCIHLQLLLLLHSGLQGIESVPAILKRRRGKTPGQVNSSSMGWHIKWGRWEGVERRTKRCCSSAHSDWMHPDWGVFVFLDVLVYPNKSRTCDGCPNAQRWQAVANWSLTSDSATTRIGKLRWAEINAGFLRQCVWVLEATEISCKEINGINHFMSTTPIHSHAGSDRVPLATLSVQTDAGSPYQSKTQQ